MISYSLMEHVFFEFKSCNVLASVKGEEKVLVRDLCFEIGRGESLALIGETGSGKTMTALNIMDLLPVNVRCECKKIFLDGQDLGAMPEKSFRKLIGRDIVYIPQNGADYLNPSRKIGKQIFDSLGKKDTELALEKLRLAGLDNPEEFTDRYPFQLSGGQNQRVTIALALCGSPKLLIADEPTNGLDQERKAAFLSNLDMLFPQAAKIIITHDISVARQCRQIVVLRKGQVEEQGLCSEVLQSPKSEYTKALMAALVENGMNNAF